MRRGQGRIGTDERKTGVSLLKTKNGGGNGKYRNAREEDHDPRVLKGIPGIISKKKENPIDIAGIDYTA